MKPKNQINLYVHPLFKKKLKSESAMKDMSMIKYTKYLASENSLEDYFKNVKKKDKDYDNPFRL